METCERADIGPAAMLVGELPLTGQLPCLSMLDRGRRLWGPETLSTAGSSCCISCRSLAAEALNAPCVELLQGSRRREVLICLVVGIDEASFTVSMAFQ